MRFSLLTLCVFLCLLACKKDEKGEITGQNETVQAPCRSSIVVGDSTAECQVLMIDTTLYPYDLSQDSSFLNFDINGDQLADYQLKYIKGLNLSRVDIIILNDNFEFLINDALPFKTCYWVSFAYEDCVGFINTGDVLDSSENWQGGRSLYMFFSDDGQGDIHCSCTAYLALREKVNGNYKYYSVLDFTNYHSPRGIRRREIIWTQ